MSPVRLIALYLPQFHPILENDLWWGKGFTEWTNAAKARPLWPGHYQPHVPSELGFYDLRCAETRQAQADLAREYGIEAFCYYHYWFGHGRRILERPFNEVVASGEPDFPFCLCWANETWTGIWHGAPHRVLVEQTYPGEEDHRRHFEALLPAFLDRRHITIDGKPIFCVYKPEKVPNPQATWDLWRRMATDAGLPGLHILGSSAIADWSPADNGYDGKICQPLMLANRWISKRQPLAWIKRQAAITAGLPSFHDARLFISEMERNRLLPYEWHACLIHAFDNTPRSGQNGLVVTHATPEQFTSLVEVAVDLASRNEPERRLVFLKSWNEWAEGNHLEPDLRHGRAYLDGLRKAVRIVATG